MKEGERFWVGSFGKALALLVRSFGNAHYFHLSVTTEVLSRRPMHGDNPKHLPGTRGSRVFPPPASHGPVDVVACQGMGFRECANGETLDGAWMSLNGNPTATEFWPSLGASGYIAVL